MVKLHPQAGQSIQLVAYEGPRDSFSEGLYMALDRSYHDNLPISLEGTEFDMRLDSVNIFYRNSIDFFSCDNDYVKIEICGKLIDRPVDEPTKVTVKKVSNGPTQA